MSYENLNESIQEFTKSFFGEKEYGLIHLSYNLDSPNQLTAYFSSSIDGKLQSFILPNELDEVHKPETNSPNLILLTLMKVIKNISQSKPKNCYKIAFDSIYPNDGIDKKIKGTISNISIFNALKGNSISDYFWCLPICSIPSPCFWILLPYTPNINQILENSYFVLQLVYEGYIKEYLLQKLLADFATIEWDRISSYDQLATLFSKRISEFYLCKKYRITFPNKYKSPLIQPGYLDFGESYKKIRLNLPKEVQIELELPSIPNPYSHNMPESYLHELGYHTSSLSRFNYTLERLFFLIYSIWHQSAKLSKAQFDQIITFQQKQESLFKHLSASFDQSKSIFQKIQTNSSDPNSHSIDSLYVFYKGTTDWQIRFNNKAIKLKSRSEKGLLYIHKLLLNPFQKFFPHELEMKRIDSEGETNIQISDNLSVKIDSVYSNHPESEHDLLTALKRLQEKRPNKNDPLEDQLYFYSNMVYLAQVLSEIVPRSDYIHLYRESYENLKDLEFEFIEQYNDRHYVNTILKGSKSIRYVDINIQKRKVYQRVTKAIKKAIDSIDSAELKKYFDHTLEIGMKSSYNPSPDLEVDWKLFIE